MKRTIFARFLHSSAMNQKGYSLVETALFVVGLGVLMTAGTLIYDQYRQREAQVVTAGKVSKLEFAMQEYLARNGRFPCPASMTAAPDTAEFGAEMKDAGDPDKCTGHFADNGTGGGKVWTGAVPTRTLNIPDEMAMDGYGHRFAYAITEAYTTTANSPLSTGKSAITIVDGKGNNASSAPGNVTYAFLTMGDDSHGAYSLGGQLIQPCDDTLASGVNCAFQNGGNGGKFTNDVVKVTARNAAQFTHSVDYRTVMVSECDETAGMSTPKNIAYLVDTSLSMKEGSVCPPTLEGDCWRIDVARWAVSQVIPARLAQIEFNQNYKDNENTTGEDDNETPGTMLTGFVGDDNNITSGKITNKFNQNPIAVDDNSAAQQLINNMCPSGKTPLGVHLAALADQIGDGTQNNPNKIMVISDGESNVGDDPVAVATVIHQKYPNLQIDIIDTTNNESLPQISALTGGIYSQASEGNAILDKMMKFSGICGSKLPKYTPITPTPTCSQQSGAVPVGTQQANSNGNGGTSGNGNSGNTNGNSGNGNGNGNGRGGRGRS